MIHRHLWHPLAKNVIGVWSKRNDPTDEVHFLGMVQECNCRKMRFVPDDPRLRVVEVVA